MIIHRIGPLSCAKVAGVVYGVFGLVMGAFFSLFALVGGLATASFAAAGVRPPLWFGLASGLGAVLVLPVLYAVMGFLSTLIACALYNVVARAVGGIEIDVS